MLAIYRKELKNYFINMTGYIFIGFMLVVTGIFTTLINLISTYPSFENVLSNITIVFLLIIPILTMRSVAEERHSKTDQLLYSLPVSVTQVVLAKYLAMFTVFLIPVGIIALYPLILSIFGTVYLGTAYGALLGFTLLGGVLIAIGYEVDSVTDTFLGELSAIPTMLTWFIVVMGLVPGILGLVAWVILKKYPITDAIRADMDQKLNK